MPIFFLFEMIFGSNKNKWIHKKYCRPTAPPDAFFSACRTQFQCTDPASTPTAFSSSCATPCSRRSPVRTPQTCTQEPWLVSLDTHLFPCPQFPVKPSPSKKSRGGGQGGLRRAPTLGGPTPLSHATGQPGSESRLLYHSHFKSTESEAEGGKKHCYTESSWPLSPVKSWKQTCLSVFPGVQSVPDLVPRTPPPADMSSSSQGDPAVDPNSPPLQ